MDLLLVHHLQVCGTIEEGRVRRYRLATDFTQRQAFGVLSAVPLLVCTRRSHHIKGRVGDVVADHTTDGQFGSAVDLHVLELLAVFLGQVGQEGLRRLVKVPVDIVDRVIDVTHHDLCDRSG
ncbi:hypothetical protein D3C80_1693640 [compost metagenome]